MTLVPPTIFKYEPSSDQAIQNLKNQSLYFNSPLAFNDPFDCALSPLIKEPSEIEVNANIAKMTLMPTTSRSQRRAILSLSPSTAKERMIDDAKALVTNQCQNFNKTTGVTCFSEHYDNILMWSHYGEQHRGFCLAFDTSYEPLTKLRRVHYSDTIPSIDMMDFMIDDNFEPLFKLFCTKSIHWKYEGEWRSFHCKAGTVFPYKAQALKAIYFGARMTEENIDKICRILHDHNPDVGLYRGYRSNTKFKIEFEKFTYTPLSQE
jgi:hypothetical protein